MTGKTKNVATAALAKCKEKEAQSQVNKNVSESKPKKTESETESKKTNAELKSKEKEVEVEEEDDWLAIAKKKEEEADKRVESERFAKEKEEAEKREKSERFTKAKEDAEKIAESTRITNSKEEETKKKAKEKVEKEKKSKEKAATEKKAKEKAAAEKKVKEKTAEDNKSKEKAGKSMAEVKEPMKKSKTSKWKFADQMALVIIGQQNQVNPEDVDDEANDRNEFHIAKIAQEFVEEEEQIRHDEYPHSDGDYKNDATRANPQFRRGDGSIYLGQSFYNGIAFKECVTDYCLKTGYNLRQYRHDRDKIGFKCVGSDSCQFQVYASSLPNDQMWRIRILKSAHSCIPNGHCDMFKVPVIARLFVDKIRDEVDYYLPMKIEEIILERWKISVTRNQCQAARKTALRWLEYEADQQFARLRDYGQEIMDCNVGSTVVIDTKKSDGKDLFNRFYVCFDALRKTWKQTCRPLIGVDGCFLKNKIKGQLLVAIGRDADNAIYPIAWSVVQVENKENWLWFIRLLKKDLDLLDGDGFIMVSDRQKGLIKAVELELPKMEHRMCVRHIYANLKKDHAGKLQMKPLLWNLAWSYNESEFQQRLERIHAYDIGVYESVMKANPRRWCRAFYKVGNYCEDVENNSTESFNRTISKAREKPFVAMLESVRRLAMVRIAKRSAISHNHQGVCTPYATNFLAHEHEQASACKVMPSTNSQYEVQLSGNSYRVSLRRFTCTCCKFQICGIPCEHAYGVILHKKLNPEDYVCKWFKTSMWRLNYTEGLVPQRGFRFWPSTGANDVEIPPEPAQPGRKPTKVTKAEKKRIRGVNESPSKKQPKAKKRTMHCGMCGSSEHNCRTHDKWEAAQDAAQANSSQTSTAEE